MHNNKKFWIFEIRVFKNKNNNLFIKSNSELNNENRFWVFCDIIFKI